MQNPARRSLTKSMLEAVSSVSPHYNSETATSSRQRQEEAQEHKKYSGSSLQKQRPAGEGLLLSCCPLWHLSALALPPGSCDMRQTQTCPRGRAVSPACGEATQNTLLFRSVQHREAFRGLNPMERPWESSPQAAAISTLAMKELIKPTEGSQQGLGTLLALQGTTTCCGAQTRRPRLCRVGEKQLLRGPGQCFMPPINVQK